MPHDATQNIVQSARRFAEAGSAIHDELISSETVESVIDSLNRQTAERNTLTHAGFVFMSPETLAKLAVFEHPRVRPPTSRRAGTYISDLKPRLKGYRALIQATPGEPGMVLAQFDKEETELSTGWYKFRADEFLMEPAK